MPIDSLHEQLDGLPKSYHEAVRHNRSLLDTGFFQDASDDDEKDYRQWTRENYHPENPLSPVWHPVIIDECIKIIKEFISD
jgi:hypothetical protein